MCESSEGIATQDGRIFVRGIEDAGTLAVKPGDNDKDVCRVQYSLPAKSGRSDIAYMRVESDCVADSQTASAAVKHVAELASN